MFEQAVETWFEQLTIATMIMKGDCLPLLPNITITKSLTLEADKTDNVSASVIQSQAAQHVLLESFAVRNPIVLFSTRQQQLTIQLEMSLRMSRLHSLELQLSDFLLLCSIESFPNKLRQLTVYFKDCSLLTFEAMWTGIG